MTRPQDASGQRELASCLLDSEGRGLTVALVRAADDDRQDRR